MPIAKPKLLFCLITSLFCLTFGVGCRGFFVNPTLTTITVGPATPSVQQGSTLQMTATGTFDDVGSTGQHIADDRDGNLRRRQQEDADR